MMSHESRGGEACIVCGRTDREGIHICHQLICDSCRERIVATDVTDQKYRYFLNKLAGLNIAGTRREKVHHSGQ
ncbi:MAG: sigma factor G inhibitor Gin [Sporolactobacillus sp.]|nr:sigma factor G inhibitor Gin [Sporolactobacillus sp.]MCI1881034.1 sigma factor G inhibitor Gin [Sporolactobacillus sp.]